MRAKNQIALAAENIMRNRLKILLLLSLSSLIIMAAPLWAEQSFFRWEHFVVNEDLGPQKSAKINFIEKSAISREISDMIKGSNDLDMRKDDPAVKNGDKKSILMRFKLSVSQINNDDFIMTRKDYRSTENDKVTKIMKELPNLLHGDSQEAIKNLGKMIEPHVKIGIEF